MRRLSSGWTVLVAFGALAFAAVPVLAPGRLHTALDAFVLYLAAIGLAAAVRATRAASPVMGDPPTLEPSDSRKTAPDRPVDLQRLERDVDLSLSSSFYLHNRLLPLLRGVVAMRLLVRHGIDLDRRPEAAREIVGDTAWSWVRPDREPPRDRWQVGPSFAELRAVVDAVERI